VTERTADRAGLVACGRLDERVDFAFASVDTVAEIR
jgi:hypothetical protein